MKYYFNSADINLKDVSGKTPKQVTEAIANANKTINLTFMQKLSAGIKAKMQEKKGKTQQSNSIDNLFNK